MTANVIKGTVIGLLTGLAACAGDHTISEPTDVALPPGHAELVSAIKAGQAALQNDDGAALDAAANQLNALKARPLSGTTNLEKAWRAQGVTPPMRGRVQGPGYRVADLASGETDTFAEIFYGIEETQVSVSGDGRYTVDILDEAGRPPLCEGEAVCRFVPDVTARYEIRVHNRGEAGTYIFVVD